MDPASCLRRRAGRDADGIHPARSTRPVRPFWSSSPPQATGAAGTAGGGGGGTAGGGGTGPDAGIICPHEVGPADCSASYPASCRPFWTDVLANPVCEPGAVDHSYEVRFDCNGYHVSQVQHVDSVQTYFYDATTGALVASYGLGNLFPNCVAGAPSGVDAKCPNATAIQVCPIDAGARIYWPVGS
jgi:hypothetical protein